MTPEQRELVRYRLERARTALRDARSLFELGSLSTCVNRLYYACFYSVTALLAIRNLVSTKHTGVRSLLHQHFVRPGLVSISSSDLYGALFRYRQQFDYVDFSDATQEQVEEWLPAAECFVAEIVAIIDREKASSE
ncbi:MAG: HEPN domain-containing protein [Candidatus Hydrogenedentes bacterium]|nr:HEPN domain-containing protein [Candidatus Hydrogenedentota bacterium]